MKQALRSIQAFGCGNFRKGWDASFRKWGFVSLFFIAGFSFRADSQNCTITGPTTVCHGSANSLFSVVPTAGSPTYTWTLINNTSGASIVNNPSNSEATINHGTTAGSYQVLVEVIGSDPLVSCTTTVTVNNPITITDQPDPITRGIGCNASFSVEASGTGTITYQWRKNGVNIGGANSDTYIINNVAAIDAAGYDVVVTNSCGSIISNPGILTVSAPLNPGAFVTTSVTACTGYHPSFTLNSPAPSGGTGSYTYQWQLNGIDISGATAISYDPGQLLTPGIYTYKSIVSDGCTSVSTTEKTITIVADPIVTITGGGTVCHNGSITLGTNITGGTGAYTYRWESGTSSSGPWTTIVTGNFPTYSPPAGTTGTFFYRVVLEPNVASCNNASNSITVIVNALPTITLGTNPSICSGATAANLPYSAITGAANLYSIDYDGTANTAGFTDVSNLAIGASNIVLVVPAAAPTGVYNATLTVSNNTCESNNYPITITVNARPLPTITGPANVCAGNPGIVYTTEAGMSGYSWTLSSGGSIVSGASTNSIVVDWTAATGSRTITVNYTNGNSCTAAAAASHTIMVNANPTATITGTTSFCAGGSTLLTANANPGSGSISSYQWNLNGNLISGAVSSSFTANTAGDYTVTVDNSNGCTMTSAITTVTINATPAAPTVTSPVVYCQGTTPVALTATPTPGNTLLWYTVPTGGTGSTTAPTPSTATVGSTTYYVSQETALNCEGPRAAITVTINATPAAPTVTSPVVYCQGTTPVALTATPTPGNTLLWYTVPTGGTGSTTAPTPSTATVGSTTYYVSQETALNCEGPRAAITVTINATPAAPTVTSPVVYCEGTTPVALTATTAPGNTLLWYTLPTGGTGSTTAPTPSTATVGSTTYYVSQETALNCEGPRAAITVTINATPAAPTVTSPVVYCEGTTPVALTATPTPGNSLLWYTVPTGGTGSATTPTPSTATVGSTTYYVSQETALNCEGPRAAITVTINATPAAPTVTSPVVYCQGTTPVALTATPTPGNSLLWYTVPTGGTGSATTPTPSTATVGSTTYYVSQETALNCEGPRAAITVTINATPAAPTVASPVVYCQGTTPVALTATTAPGNTLLWYTLPTGGTGSTTAPTPSTATVGSTTYYVSQETALNCEGPRAAITVTVIAVPTITLGTNPSVCRSITTAPLPYSAPTGTPNQYSIVYDAAALAAGFVNVTNAALPAGSITLTVPAAAPADIYNATLTVRNSTTGCVSNTYPITVTVNARPVPTITGPASACAGSSGNIYTTEAGMTGYTWIVSAGGTIAAGAGTNSITVSWTTTSAKTVTVNYTDANGCNATTSTSYPVTVNANPTATITGAVSFCAGGSTVLSATTSIPGSGAINGYQWNLAGTPITGANSSTYTVTAAGSYTVTVTNSNNCSTTSAATNVTINATPTITLGANPSVCRGIASASIPYSATTGSPNQYSIDYDAAANTAGFVDIINGTLGVSPRLLTVPAAAPAGIYNATLTVRNSTTGCVSNTYPITVTVNARPVPTITGPASACAGSSGNIYTTEAGMTGYTWIVSAGGTIAAGAGTNSITVSWTTTGAKTVTVNYTDANGCNATTSTSYPVTVNANPTAVITGPTSFCAGGSIDLLATTSIAGSGTISGYQWNLDGTPISGATSSSYTATVPGSYTVTVTNSNNCSTTSAVRNITANTLPTITLGANPSVCRGIATTSISFSTTGAPTQYSIDYDAAANAAGFVDISNSTLGTSPRTLAVPAAAPAGIYNATLTVRNSTTGCVSNSYPITVTVNARPVPTITGPASACAGSSGNIYTTEAGMTGYTWIVSAGGTTAAGAGTNSITVSWTTTGAKTVTVNYTDANGCNATTSTSFPVTVNANPTVNPITGPTSVCAGSTITVANTTPGGVWSSSNPAIATVSNSGVVTGVSAGPVTISYAVTNGNGCTTTVNRSITVNAIPSITVPTPPAFCSGGTVTLTATGANTYSWSPSTGLSITTGATVIATPEITTTYTVTGTITATGCSNSTTVTVTVIQSPKGDLSSDPSVCYGDNSGTITLSNYTGSIIQWESSTNGGANWTVLTPTTPTTYSYSDLTQTTIYRVLLSLNGCTSYSSIGIVPVNPPFIPIVTATPASICLGQSAVLHASDYGPPPFPVEDFQNAQPAGWSGDNAGNNNGDNNSPWGLTNGPKTLNGVIYNSNALPTNTKFAIATGNGGGSPTSLITPPFSLIGVINPIFNFYTAMNLGVGATANVQISIDGGLTYIALQTYTGPTNLGNPNNNWAQVSINLSAYVGNPNVRVRFLYSGTTGSNWGVDNVGLTGTFQPVTYQWSPTIYLTPSNGVGQDVTTTPTAPGTYNYCVVATTAAGCSSPPVCLDVVVKPLPTCAIDGDGPVCPGSTKVYSGPAIAGYTYNWSISGGGGIISGSSTGQTVTVIANNSCGTYTLTLITTLNGCASAPCTVTVNVADTEPPVWTTAPGSLDRTIACNDATALANAQALSPVATDNCGTIVYNKISGTLTVGTCASTYTNTWTARDACSNISTIFTQVITITDVQAPALTGVLPGGAQGNICLAAAPAAPSGATIASLYTDNCRTVTATLTNTVTTGNNCAWTVTYSYTVTDGCNPITVDVVYTGGDTQAPVTTCPSAQIFCVVANGSYTIPPLIASDNCSGALTITFQITGATIRNGTGDNASGVFNPGASTITWTVTDACGNVSTCTTPVTINPKPAPIIYHN